MIRATHAAHIRRAAPLLALLLGAALSPHALGCGRGAATLQAPGAKSATEATAVREVIQVAFIGEGTLEVRDEAAGVSKLALERLAVRAETSGDVAETQVEHVFRNDTDETLEGTFRFPLPDGAILTGLAMEIEGRLMHGELVEREKARRVYEEIVDQMLDPALLEWESGQVFKLRVFPIEPHKTKRVVLTFVAPLHRASDGLHFAWRAPDGGGAPLENVSVTLDGKALDVAKARRAEGGELLAKVRSEAPTVVVETREDGAYYALRGEPRFEAEEPSAPQKPQALIVLADRSRSMLEARALQAKTLGMLASELGARDAFTVVTGDVSTRAQQGGLVAASKDASAIAVAFLDETTPDGASDLGKLFAEAGTLVRAAKAKNLEPTVVLLGDANPTWGETRTDALVEVARRELDGASMHVVMLGKSPDEQVARALTDALHGRLFRPMTEDEALRAAHGVAEARTVRRVEGVHLVGDLGGVDLPGGVPTALYEGDPVELTMFVPRGKAAPALSFAGTVNGKPFALGLGVDRALPARHVAKRWAKAKIARLEREGDARKQDVVATSLTHGVLSRHTSFLVLESEEAYARHQIERRAKQRDTDEARVTGRDLEGGSGGDASVTPDHLQPGDPEVRIPAPEDASSVVVVFPFGETKAASFERDPHGGGAWVVRFLVDRATPDGSYTIVARVTHRDGRVEILEIPYVVDTQTPMFDVRVRAKGDGTYEIRAKQRITAEEIAALAPESEGSLDERRRRHAHVLTDAKRVEVQAPDGQAIALTHVTLGDFVGTWRPTTPPAPGAKIRLVAVDRALNQTELEAEVP